MTDCGDAFVAAPEVGFESTCEIVSGAPCGTDTLIRHMREVVPLTEHESHLREPTLSREDFQGNSEKSQPIDEMRDGGKARNDFWSIEGDHIYRHYNEPRVQIICRRKKVSNFHVTRTDSARRPS